ncbi:MAG: response regulator [Chloroflexota bacterium]
MSMETIYILLIENSLQDTALIEQVLSSATLQHHTVRYDLVHMTNLSAGLSHVAESKVDAILLDWDLPDSQGIDSITEICKQPSQPPILVLMSSEDEMLAMQAIQAGAQDYIYKSEITRLALTRAIRYIQERHRLRQKLAQSHLEQSQQQEFAKLNQLNSTSNSPATQQAFGGTSLQQALPSIFQTLATQYQTALDMALEERMYRIDAQCAEQLRQIADELGSYMAGPKDVIDIHKITLASLDKKMSNQKLQAYIEEGRLRVLELMGYLALYYRNHRSQIHQSTQNT